MHTLDHKYLLEYFLKFYNYFRILEYNYAIIMYPK